MSEARSVQVLESEGEALVAVQLISGVFLSMVPCPCCISRPVTRSARNLHPGIGIDLMVRLEQTHLLNL